MSSISLKSNLFYLLNRIVIFLQQNLIKLISFIFFKKKQKKNSQNDNVLVFRGGGLGDFLFALPAFNLLREETKNSRIFLITYVAAGGAHLENLKRKNISSPTWISLVDNLFDEIMILENISLKNILSKRKQIKLLKINKAILMGGPGEPFLSVLKKLFLLKLIGLRKINVTFTEQKFSLSFFRKFHQKWGFASHKVNGPWEAAEKYLNKKYDVKDYYYLSKKLENLKIQKDNYENFMVISPGSSHKWKNWGESNFQELIFLLEDFINKKNMSLVITGPESDKELGERIKSNNKKIINECGNFSIDELAYLFSKAKLVLTNDGGAAHLAALTGTKLISLSNGAEEPGIVTPIGENVIEHRNLTVCTPCFGMTHCPLNHSKCIKDISVKNVYYSILKSL